MKFDRLLNSLTSYLEDRIALAKMELQEEFYSALTKVSIVFLLMIALLIFILFASVTLSFYLSAILGSYTLGFGVVTIGYLLFFVILVILKKWFNAEATLEKYIYLLFKK